MKVFKNYFKIVKAHLMAIMIYSIVFLILLMFVTKTERTDDYYSVYVNVYVKDEANTSYSRALYNYLDANCNIIDMDKNLSDDNLFYGIVSAIIEIPSNFDESNEVHYKSAPQNMGGIDIKQKVNAFISTVNSYKKSGFSLDNAISATNKDLSKHSNVHLIKKIKNDGSGLLKFYFNFMNYLLMSQIILIISLVSSVYDNSKLKQRNIVSPMPIARQNIQLILGHIVIGLIVCTAYIILLVAMWKVSIFKGTMCLFMLNAYIFTLSVVAMAVFISTFIKNTNARGGIMNVIALGSSFLSGAFVPQELLSGVTLSIARALPSYYYVKSNNMLASGAELSDISLNIGILAIFTLGFILLSVIKELKHSKKQL